MLLDEVRIVTTNTEQQEFVQKTTFSNEFEEEFFEVNYRYWKDEENYDYYSRLVVDVTYQGTILRWEKDDSLDIGR